MESTNPIVNNILYLFALAVFVVFLIFAMILRIIFIKFKEKLKKKLTQLKEKFIWNGIIRSMSIAYINLVIGAYLKLKEIRKCPEHTTPAAAATAFVMTTIIIGYIVIVLVCLMKKKNRLNEPEVRDRIGNMYIDVTINENSRWSWLYYPTFLFRRVMLLMIPLMFYN